MLAYILAIAIAFISLAIYLAAFLFPDVHRKDDFFWSGIGLFYALVVWSCASRITGAVLLGQIASVSLIAWFSWQTVIYRRAVARPQEKAEILNFSLLEWLQTKITVKKPQISTTKTNVVTPITTSTNDIETNIEVEEIVPTPITQGSNLNEEINKEIEEITTESIVSENNTNELVISDEDRQETEEQTETILGKKVEQEDQLTEINAKSQLISTKKKAFPLSNFLSKIPLPFKKKAQQPLTSKLPQDNELTVNQKLEEKTNINTESLLNLLDDNITETKTEPEKLSENIQPTAEFESIKITEEKSVEIVLAQVKEETADNENLEIESETTKLEETQTKQTNFTNPQNESKLEQEIIENTGNQGQETIIEISTEVSTESNENEPKKIIQKTKKIISKSNKTPTSQPEVADQIIESQEQKKEEQNSEDDDNPFNDLKS